MTDGMGILPPWGGGTQIWFGRGAAAQASKPLPMFKGHFGKRGTHFKGFLSNRRPIFHNFQVYFGNFGKTDPCLEIFL